MSGGDSRWSVLDAGDSMSPETLLLPQEDPCSVLVSSAYQESHLTLFAWC